MRLVALSVLISCAPAVVPERGIAHVLVTRDAPDSLTFASAQPSDYSPQDYLHVLAVDASVDPRAYSGACPHGKRFRFEGAITVDGPGVVTFTWERSDGAYDGGGPRRIVFDRAGTQRISTYWQLSAHGERFWKRLRVFTPHEMISAPAEFVVDCDP